MASREDLADCDFLFKFIVIGDTSVGKSCLVYHFVEDKPKPSSTHTVGVEFGSKVIEVGGRRIKLQIWDTAGQERFRSVTKSYYRAAAGALLLYDISNRDTFNTLSMWLNDVRSLAAPNVAVILCGNKCDLKDDREITFLEASRYAVENELLFLETSALIGSNVQEVFQKASRSILNRIETGQIDPYDPASGVKVSERIRVTRTKPNPVDTLGVRQRERDTQKDNTCQC